jgi:rRNA-processing protein FCF1
MSEITSYTARLKQDFQKIESQVMELLEISTIKEFRNDPNSGIVFITPPYEWGETNEQQKILQMLLVKKYSDWIEHFRLLFSSASQEINQQIAETQKFITSWIEKESSWEVPSSIESAKSLFHEKVRVFYELLNLLETTGKHEIIVVPDTNSLIAVPDLAQYVSAAGQPKYTVIIVPTVLGELDKLKIIHREPEFRDKVNSVIKRIKGLRTQGSLLAGVTINKTVTVRMIATEPDFDITLKWLDSENTDDKIIASVLEIQKENPSSVVVVATSDINLQNKAEMAGLPFVETPVV